MEPYVSSYCGPFVNFCTDNRDIRSTSMTVLYDLLFREKFLDDCCSPSGNKIIADRIRLS